MSNKWIDKIAFGGIVSVRDGLIKQQEQGRKVYRLESGDPSFSIPVHVGEAITKALHDGHTHYTAGAGIMPLRQAAAEKLAIQNGINVKPTDVFVTNGAMHGLYVVFRALCGIGHGIIMPDPTWTETADNVTLAGGVPIRVPGPYVAENIIKYIVPSTKAIVINSPHNPTGAVLSRADIEGIVNLAAKFDLWIISDEAYEHIVYDKEHVSPGSMYDKTISIYSFSKSYAMSGLRLGYLATPFDDPETKMRIAKLLRCSINGVNSSVQYGGIAALNGPQDFIQDMVKEYKVRRDALYGALQKCSLLHPVEPQGAFYCWCKIDESWDKDEWALTNYLIDELAVGSVPGTIFGPGGQNHLRFAFSCSTDQVLDASRILGEF
ncbi:MAG: pyridoxal phosphate-dependent aminotransferase [Candidatus Ranarchaeia archaeon]